MDRSPGAIRTPDQRLRVFVSSTLKELATERKASRTAIERLHLAPVMFELGARPHPPRALYRAYLEQSDIFVGLYAERYGWVAPDERVSGLEDEYNLSGRMPKLIYIRETSEQREPRLEELLGRIRDDDQASFKYFADSRELGRLLESDLATLLAERFDEAGSVAADVPGAAPRIRPRPLPAPLTELIGRDTEAAEVHQLIRREAVRLVTLTGPGGIGKSRLAMDVAAGAADDFPGGVAFTDLSGVHDAAILPTVIAETLGVQNTGEGNALEDKLLMAMQDRRILLVLDNFEQIVDAAPTLTRLLEGAPGLTLLVTSRSLLRVSAEHVYPVGPLALPAESVEADPDDIAQVASVALFIERARAVKPDFEVTGANIAAVAQICRTLDGVPLALELAAARTRVLTPDAILARLDQQLQLLVGGGRDRPERQQTLRGTIEWSAQLLGGDERALLVELGVFEGGFSLDAVEAVALPDEGDALSLLAGLVDSSLVRQAESGGRPFFTMLSTVRDYAREQLETTNRLEAARERHAQYFIRFGQEAERPLESSEQRTWISQLVDDRNNLRAAARYLLDQHDWERAAGFAWSLYIYWWIGGHLGEVKRWMGEVLDAGEPLGELTEAIALYFTRAITIWQDPDGLVIPGLERSAELFRRAGRPTNQALALISLALARLASATPDPTAAERDLDVSLTLFRDAGDRWGQSMALVTRGRVALLRQSVQEAKACFEESLAFASAQQDRLSEAIALHHLAWARLLTGGEGADEAFEHSLRLSEELGHAEGIAYGLEGMVALAASAGDPLRAGTLFGAAQRLRERSGLYDVPTFSFHERFVEQFRSGEAASAFDSALRQGRRISTDEAVAEALMTGVA
ncbi:DUF4062 domain-containing protein [Diaminobutyricimonas sp. TR449]|uniref:ATP-binding protein n=1 Tax=Diaminobutyricimonas sp. TR449 TaxID=2708076 RepID=UPI00141F5306|nr:DUF4062 domain-containing protein [Diaminobutyricimonas sp. TR449]